MTRSGSWARRRTPALAMVVGLVVLVASCGGDDPAGPSAEGSPTSTASTTAGTGSTPATAATGELGGIDSGYVGDGPRVSVVGDSLTVSSRDDLVATLDGYRVKIAALRGEGLSGGPLSTRWGYPIMESTLADDSEDPPDVLVFALGTNDAWRDDRTVEAFDAVWDEVLAQLPDTCLVGVTLTEDAPANARYDPGEAAHINERIRAGVDVVVDWAAEGGDPRYTDPADTIHLTEEGAELRARLIRTGVDACLDRADG